MNAEGAEVKRGRRVRGRWLKPRSGLERRCEARPKIGVDAFLPQTALRPLLTTVSSALNSNSCPTTDSLAELNLLTGQIIGAAMKVHSTLGPGLLESAYEACLAYELTKLGLSVERQKRQPIIYGELKLEEGYRIDLFVDRRVVVELKAIEQIRDVHEAQLLSYLRLARCEVGLVINFHVPHLREGIRCVINSRS